MYYLAILGFLCVRYPEMMFKKEAKDFNLSCLTVEDEVCGMQHHTFRMIGNCY